MRARVACTGYVGDFILYGNGRMSPITIVIKRVSPQQPPERPTYAHKNTKNDHWLMSTRGYISHCSRRFITANVKLTLCAGGRRTLAGLRHQILWRCVDNATELDSELGGVGLVIQTFCFVASLGTHFEKELWRFLAERAQQF